MGGRPCQDWQAMVYNSPMDPNRYRLLQTLEAIGALFIAAGLLTMLAGLQQFRAGQAAGGWPATSGQIVANETVRVAQRGRSVTIIDAARIAYRYSVDGRAYESERVTPNALPARTDSAEGRRRAAAYPLGAAVTVYYDPANPARSLLERPPQTAALRSGGLLVGLGLAVLLARRLANRL